ncbi:hypothetical protein JTE90_026490 [Oedothorax gibbosus]|uniref:GOLD domain-containing protein n=1 Tax=Oedothorax gibbosus TaxID=931172 RepID=A0AAV6VPG9_9ARAC|nr:hypothetical protein JTE90_026490 [Oedothorax gibbosus]
MAGCWNGIVIIIASLYGSIFAHDPKFDLADIEFTTIVKANSEECFYQYAKPKQTLRFEYRVVDSGLTSLNRDLKISFSVRTPKGKTIIKEIEKTQAIKKHDVLESGDYEMCLDNKFSQFTSKTVYLEVSIDVDSEGYRWTLFNEALEKDKLKNDTISLLKRTANKVKGHLERMKHFQDTLRVREARDIHLQEQNLTKVNAFSSLTSVSMMLFGGLHLFIVKSMFNPSSALFKVFKKLIF